MADSYYNDTYNMGVDSDGNSFYYNTDTGITYYSNGDSSYYNSYTDITYYSNGDSSYYNSSYDITYYSSGDSSYYNSTYGMRYGGPSSSSSDTSSSSSDSSYDYSYSSSSYSGSSLGYSYYSSPKSKPLSKHDKELGNSAAKVLGFLGLGFLGFCVLIICISLVGSAGFIGVLVGFTKAEVSGVNCSVTDDDVFFMFSENDFGVVPDQGYELAYFISGDDYIYEPKFKPALDAKKIVAVCLPEGNGKIVTESSIKIPISTDEEDVGSEYFNSGSDSGTNNVRNFYIKGSVKEELEKMAEKYSTVKITFTLDIREESKILSSDCSMYGEDLTNSKQVVGILFGGDMGFVTFDHGGDDIKTNYETHTKTVTIPTKYIENSMQVFFRIDESYTNGTKDCPAWYMKNAYITFEFSN